LRIKSRLDTLGVYLRETKKMDFQRRDYIAKPQL
jgi:hypothetical protein